MRFQHTDRWSVGFGVWWGVPVRLHMLLLLFAVLTLGMTIEDRETLVIGGVMLAVLLVSVAFHEAAHAIAAIFLGGEVDEIVLSPIGGLSAPKVPNEPEPQVFVAMVGPMVNLALLVVSTAALVYLGETAILPLFNPVAPGGLFEGSLAVETIKLTAWINWILFLLNLIPAYPFDGGPALRALLWPLLGRRSSAIVVTQVGRALALGFCLLALMIDKAEPQSVVPLWAPLMTLAIFVYFSSQQDLAFATERAAFTEDALQYPHSVAERSLGKDNWPQDDGEMVLVEKPKDFHRHEKKQQADEAYEDAQVDDILAKLHSEGFSRLSEEDRRVLQRASRRYRVRKREE